MAHAAPRVRLATIDDVEGIAVAHYGGWRAGYADILSPQTMAKYTLRQMCENWRILIGREGRTNLVAEDGGRIAGFASFAAASPGDGGPEAVAELMGMYVHPDFWGGGHAAKLFAAALEHMRAASFAEAVLWTWQANHRGRRFYEKMGFTKDASVLRDRFGQPLVEVRYRGVVATQG